MKRWLIIGIPLALFTALLFVKPPSFTAQPTPLSPTGTTSTTGAKPSIPGGGEDDGLENGQKPRYGGSQKDNYDKN